jgi:uncharacterized protein YkwD
MKHPKLHLLAVMLASNCGMHAVEFSDSTLALLKSPRPADRQRFYAVMPTLSIEEQRLAVAQLREARDYWRQPIVRQVTQAAGGQNAWSTFLKAHKEWTDSIAPLLADIRTDYHKDPKKIAELTKEFERSERLWDRARRAAGPAERGDFAKLLAACQTLHEIEKWIDNPTGAKIVQRATLADSLAGAVSGVPQDVANVKALAELNAMEQRLAEVHKFNAACRWAKPDQIRFAALLNEKRAVVNLTPLRLDEKLSQASTDHSLEMVALKYFSHESPTPEYKTFADRAKKAGFDGFASGENIFAGSRSPDAAYGGWWASDGHRHIMFMDGVNTLGVGNGGTDHWTMNPGNKSWPLAVR